MTDCGSISVDYRLSNRNNDLGLTSLNDVAATAGNCWLASFDMERDRATVSTMARSCSMVNPCVMTQQIFIDTRNATI